MRFCNLRQFFFICHPERSVVETSMRDAPNEASPLGEAVNRHILVTVD